MSNNRSKWASVLSFACLRLLQLLARQPALLIDLTSALRPMSLHRSLLMDRSNYRM